MIVIYTEYRFMLILTGVFVNPNPFHYSICKDFAKACNSSGVFLSYQLVFTCIKVQAKSMFQVERSNMSPHPVGTSFIKTLLIKN